MLISYPWCHLLFVKKNLWSGTSPFFFQIWSEDKNVSIWMDFLGAKSSGDYGRSGCGLRLYTAAWLLHWLTSVMDHSSHTRVLQANDYFGSSWAFRLQSRCHCPTYSQMYSSNSHMKGLQGYFILTYTKSTVMPSGCSINSIYEAMKLDNNHAIIGGLFMMCHLGPEQENHNP